MDFLEAMERLKRAVTDDEIAAATGVSTNTIRRTRADPATRNYRPAPRGWAPVLARLAGERAKELLKLQEELEALSHHHTLDSRADTANDRLQGASNSSAGQQGFRAAP
jgi:hypothetical protein